MIPRSLSPLDLGGLNLQPSLRSDGCIASSTFIFPELVIRVERLDFRAQLVATLRAFS